MNLKELERTYFEDLSGLLEPPVLTMDLPNEPDWGDWVPDDVTEQRYTTSLGRAVILNNKKYIFETIGEIYIPALPQAIKAGLNLSDKELERLLGDQLTPANLEGKFSKIYQGALIHLFLASRFVRDVVGMAHPNDFDEHIRISTPAFGKKSILTSLGQDIMLTVGRIFEGNSWGKVE